MSLTLEKVEQLREKMKSAPEVAPEKREVTKQEAVAALRAEIELMQKRGYTLDEIAKMISENGIELTTPTLKSYLQRAKAGKKAPRARKAGASGSAADSSGKSADDVK
jgi:hypothetical protein